MELNKNDVVTMDSAFSFKAGGIFKVGQLYTAIESYLGDTLSMWFKRKGIECEVLQVKGGGWQKGKIYLRVEFIPDELEVPQQKPSTVTREEQSPLDDLRSSLDN
ncbi:KGK domain-containing protein [Nostoc commune]|uniref:KGK domain-containing protein n=1 Tax=Nostoc commune TaxID=1178 RepID=UPI0018C6BE58|nr:KGK domain-containing protein [Nostoc commune]MBG1259298.1 KGK domain-containing protein [Nostoc commune BAE]